MDRRPRSQQPDVLKICLAEIPGLVHGRSFMDEQWNPMEANATAHFSDGREGTAPLQAVPITALTQAGENDRDAHQAESDPIGVPHEPKRLSDCVPA